MRLRPYLIASMFLGLVAVPASALADTLPSVTMAYWANIAALNGYQGSGPNQTYADSPGYSALGASPATVTDHPSGVSGASGTASVSSGSDPSVSVNATGLGAGGSSLYYEFEVSGPANKIVSATITGSGGATVSNPSLGAASASLQIGLADGDTAVYSEYLPYGGPYLVNDAVCVGACGSGGQSSGLFSVNGPFDLETDMVYAVEMNTQYSIGPGAVTASAFVDPTITLDTTDPAYSLEFSPGLIPTSTTPEPSSLLLVATGLLGGARVIRRRLFAI